MGDQAAFQSWRDIDRRHRPGEAGALKLAAESRSGETRSVFFSSTIAENIGFGTSAASRLLIQAACEAAQAAGFIESLPQGDDTLVGERGYWLD